MAPRSGATSDRSDGLLSTTWTTVIEAPRVAASTMAQWRACWLPLRLVHTYEDPESLDVHVFLLNGTGPHPMSMSVNRIDLGRRRHFGAGWGRAPGRTRSAAVPVGGRGWRRCQRGGCAGPAPPAVRSATARHPVHGGGEEHPLERESRPHPGHRIVAQRQEHREQVLLPEVRRLASRRRGARGRSRARSRHRRVRSDRAPRWESPPCSPRGAGSSGRLPRPRVGSAAARGRRRAWPRHGIPAPAGNEVQSRTFAVGGGDQGVADRIRHGLIRERFSAGAPAGHGVEQMTLVGRERHRAADAHVGDMRRVLGFGSSRTTGVRRGHRCPSAG